MQALKNKKFTKILVGLVTVLWVVIMVKILFVAADKPSNIRNMNVTSEIDKDYRNVDTNRKLNIINKDPFGMQRRKRATVKSKRPINKNIPQPDIKYLGYLQTGTKGKKMANINYQNQFIIKGENDTLEKFRLVKVFEDSILLVCENSKFYIKKSQ